MRPAVFFPAWHRKPVWHVLFSRVISIARLVFLNRCAFLANKLSGGRHPGLNIRGSGPTPG